MKRIVYEEDKKQHAMLRKKLQLKKMMISGSMSFQIIYSPNWMNNFQKMTQSFYTDTI